MGFPYLELPFLPDAGWLAIAGLAGALAKSMADLVTGWNDYPPWRQPVASDSTVKPVEYVPRRTKYCVIVVVKLALGIFGRAGSGRVHVCAG